MRRGSPGRATTTPVASARVMAPAERPPASGDAAAAQALHHVDDLAGPLGQLAIPLHDLVRRLLLLDGVLEVRHRHAEDLEHASCLIARHRLFLPHARRPWSTGMASICSGLSSLHTMPRGFRRRRRVWITQRGVTTRSTGTSWGVMGMAARST